MFPTEDKKFCIELVNKHRLPIEIVSSFCRVPKKSLCRWLSIGAERQKGCGRKLKDPQMEKKLIEWYSQAVQRGLYPSARMIRNKALQFTTAKDFLASKGWLEKFKKKYGITIYNSNVKRKLLDQSSQ